MDEEESYSLSSSSPKKTKAGDDVKKEDPKKRRLNPTDVNLPEGLSHTVELLRNELKFRNETIDALLTQINMLSQNNHKLSLINQDLRRQLDIYQNYQDSACNSNVTQMGESAPAEKLNNLPSPIPALNSSAQALNLPGPSQILLNLSSPTPALNSSAQALNLPSLTRILNPPDLGQNSVSKPLPDTLSSTSEVAPSRLYLKIVQQPPSQAIYQRILRPFPTVFLVGQLDSASNYFVEVTLLKKSISLGGGDGYQPVQWVRNGGSPLDGDRERNLVNGYAIFRKLKVLTTTSQQGAFFVLKFTLKRYVNNRVEIVPDVDSITSSTIEVFSHTLYLKTDAKAASKPRQTKKPKPSSADQKTSGESDSANLSSSSPASNSEDHESDEEVRQNSVVVESS
jgi:hypothetical protein